MTHEKLRGWLKIHDGPWPPDYYSLIGLKPGTGAAEEIESRVLERLELLRRYQLPHPDEATEGMNLLAQALDTLTDPESRRKYDRSIGVKSATRVEPPPPANDKVLEFLFPEVRLLPVDSDEPAPPADEEPILPEAILLQELEEEPDVDDEPEILEPLQPPELPAAILVPVLPPVARLEEDDRDADRRPRRPKSPRRELYADLARVRKVLRIFERARPFVTDPDRTIAKRTDALALMGCLAELRPLLPTVTDLIATGHRPGSIVAALARQRLMYDTFRSLLPGQRDSLAKDFRAAHYRLAGYYDELRDEVTRMNRKDWMRTVGRPVMKYLADHPEWLLAPVALTALAIAVARSV
jgi:hypothetical protein